MKTVISMILGMLALLTLSARANTLLINNPNTGWVTYQYIAPGCSLNLTYQNSYVNDYSLVCNSATVLTIANPTMPSSCNYPSVAAGYLLENVSGCSFEVYQVAPNPMPATCNDITYATNVAGSAVGGAMNNAIAWCKGEGTTAGLSCTSATTTPDGSNAYNIICQGGPPSYTGYVDPKFMVIGVTYAPPGASTNTFVSYASSIFVGNTTSLSQSWSFGITNTVSLSQGYAVAVSKGSVTAETSTTMTQAFKNTSTVTTSFQVQSGEKTFGTGSYFAPVDNDYDIIWVWLNPSLIFTITGTTVVWNGYGYDTADEPSPDIVGIQLGYLNGHFGPIPADIQASLNRTWAANQKWASGQVPALTSADLAHIAAADPFSVSTYGTTYLGYSLPSPETADHRFTLSTCSSESPIYYLQAGPSTTAGIDTCTLNYTSTSTQAQDITNTYTQTFSTDTSLSVTFYGALAYDLKQTQTLTFTTEAQSSLTNTTNSTAALSVQGPPCNNVVAEKGPCVPVYDSTGNQPTQFEVYQDNMYGTFMFAPVHFY